MPDRIFLDTNILVYIANEDSPFHHRVVERLRQIAGKSELWTSRQALREYAVVMTRPETVERPLSSSEVVSDIEKWKSISKIADETEEVTGILMELIKTYNIKGKKIHDANIVAAMMANSIQALFTLNVDDFRRFKKIQLIAI